MILERLDVENKEDVEFLKKLFLESFPLAERRPLDIIFDLYRDNPHFVIDVTKHEGETIGFLCYWNLDEFVFGEYFAIDPSFRNGGLGKKAFEQFMNQNTKPIIIEVELPTTILSERRIGFYQRLGFKLWENIQYQQPAYRVDTQPVPLKLMSLGNIDVEKDIAKIRSTLYTAVYDVRE